MEEERNSYRSMVRKPEGNRPLGRPRRVWLIVGWILERWTGLVWLRIGSFCESGKEPSDSIKWWETAEWLHNWWPPE
jgi:hypothetical protein